MANHSAGAPVRYRTFIALVSAGFRRYSTYRQATLAGLFTNVLFGFMRTYVLLAVVGRQAAGYDARQIVTYVWVSQGLIATVGLWGELGLADRIRTGDVVADLLRPVPPVFAYLADIFVLPGHRGRGLGVWLVETMLAHPELQGLRRTFLVTDDAHGLYRRFGFGPPQGVERFLEIARDPSELY